MNNRIGCLVIHGFGGSIKEVEPLVLRLLEREYKVMVPSLKGHTGKREDLKNISYTEWINSAESNLLSLLSSCEVVYIIGFSMGGLIAINLGLKHQIGGIVTINTPIYYWNVKRIMINIASDIVKRDLRNSRRYLNSSKQLPFTALLNFKLLLSKTKSKIKDLKCPIYIIQAINDDTVRKSSANYLFNHVGSEVKQLKFFDCSEHHILWSSDADKATEHIIEFLNEK